MKASLNFLVLFRWQGKKDCYNWRRIVSKEITVVKLFLRQMIIQTWGTDNVFIRYLVTQKAACKQSLILLTTPWLRLRNGGSAWIASSFWSGHSPSLWTTCFFFSFVKLGFWVKAYITKSNGHNWAFCTKHMAIRLGSSMAKQLGAFRVLDLRQLEAPSPTLTASWIFVSLSLSLNSWSYWYICK